VHPIDERRTEKVHAKEKLKILARPGARSS